MVKVQYWEKNPVCALNTSKESAVFSPLHMKVSSPGRAAYLPPILRFYKHNVFKSWLCLFVWLGFFSNRNDRAFYYNYLLLLSFPIFQSSHWLFPWRWISSLWQQELMSFEGAEGVSVNPCKQCNAGQEALMCDSTWKCSRHLWWLLLSQKHQFYVQGKECAHLLRYSNIQG